MNKVYDEKKVGVEWVEFGGVQRCKSTLAVSRTENVNGCSLLCQTGRPANGTVIKFGPSFDQSD